MQTTLHQFKIMGGPGQIQLPESPAAPAALQAVHAELQRLENKYSRYKPSSLISQINAQAGRRYTPCDEETWSLLQYAQQLHDRSNGLFDITSGVYRKAWCFSNTEIPSQASLDALRPLVGWTHVKMQDHQIALPREGMEIDLGGLVKEYAVDSTCSILQAHGIHAALISLAGDMRALGTKPNGQDWQAGIAHPRKPGQLMATIPLNQMALATSGDYERAIVRHGKRYAHILHPHTGWPVQYWQSVSIQASTCLMAGSLCTLTMLMQAQGLALLRECGLSYLAIDANGHVHQG